MTQKKRVRTAAVAVAGALIVGVSACGGDDGGHFDGKEPVEIAEESREAMLELTSLSMETERHVDGEAPLTLKVSFTTGGDCSGTLTHGEDDGTGEFRRVDGTTYLSGDQTFWANRAGEDAEQLAGRWVKEPDGSGVEGFCSMEDILAQLETDGTEDGDWESIDGETIDGTKTVGVSNVKDPENVSHLYIADNGDAHILQLTRGDGAGKVLFKDFDKDFTFEAPAEDDILEYGDLG